MASHPEVEESLMEFTPEEQALVVEVYKRMENGKKLPTNKREGILAVFKKFPEGPKRKDLLKKFSQYNSDHQDDPSDDEDYDAPNKPNRNNLEPAATIVLQAFRYAIAAYTVYAIKGFADKILDQNRKVHLEVQYNRDGFNVNIGIDNVEQGTRDNYSVRANIKNDQDSE